MVGLGSGWSGLDGPTLVASAAGLQLLEENVPCLVRLQRLAAIGASLPPRPAALALTPSRLRGLLRQSPVDTPSVRAQEDRYDDLYVEEVPFHGGASLVMQGLTSRAAHTLRVLLPSIFGPSGKELPNQYRAGAYALTRAVLDVSNEVCRAAGISRHIPPPERRGGVTFVPGRERLDQLRAAVTFSPDRLAATIRGSEAPLVHLSAEAGSHPVGFKEGTDDGLILTPFVRAGDDLIVANPGELAAALRHSLIVLANHLGCRDQLAAAFRETVAHEVETLLDLIGAVPEGEWESTDDALVLRRTFNGSANTVIDVGVLTDDLSDYDHTDPYGAWPNNSAGVTLQDALDVAPEAAAAGKRLLRLAVTDGVARYTFYGFGEPRTKIPFLWTPLDELRVMIELDGGDPLFLWRFADALDELHENARVMSFSVLDTYGIYRGNDQSFYLSDEAAPNIVSVEVANGAPLRAEAHRAIGRHHVVAPDGHRLVEVLKMNGALSPVHFVHPQHGLYALLVEMPHFTAWVSPTAAGAAMPVRQLLGDVAEAVAYWLWQLARASDAGARVDLPSSLHVSVAADDLDAWLRALAGQAADDAATTATTSWVTAARAADGGISVVIHADRHSRLLEPANTADRELLGALIHTVAEPALTEQQATALVELVAPVGPKKILNAVGGHNVLLRPIDAHVRLVQPAVTALLLDDLGEWLQTQQLSVGPISSTDRTKVLGKAVDYYYTRLTQTVAELSPGGLLEFLVRQDEALLRDQQHRNENLDTRIACYGLEREFADELTKDVSRHVEASVASRFLIEYVAATPPSGSQAIDLMAYDELLALAAELISRATISDAIHYKFSDVQLSILPSGRLGVSRGDRYSAGTQELARVQTDARLALSATAAKTDREEVEDSAPLPINEVDVAMAAEFSFTLTDHANACGELINLADDLGAEPASAPMSDVEGHLVATLDWDLTKACKYLDRLSLRPRNEFLAIGPDAYPWRYNRDQSYLRRPLIQYTGADGQLRLTWGVRRVWSSGHYWLQLIFSGRMRGDTDAMKKLTGWIRQKENNDFERQVAQALRAAGMPHDAHGVKRVGGHRLISSEGRDLGDIDALAVDPARRVVVIAEAKDFEQARTPVELANEADDLLTGDASAVAKSQRRVAWVRSNLGRVLDHFELSTSASGWQVEGVVVTSIPLITPRVLATPLPVLSIDELPEWVRQLGRSPSSGGSRRRRSRR